MSLLLTRTVPSINSSAGGTLWTPADITTYAWYDATDSGTITESSGSVSNWNDVDSQGRNLVQTTGSEQPTTNSRTQNGLNVIDFDGTEFLDTTGYSLGTNTFIIAMAWLDSDTSFGIYGASTNHYDRFTDGLTYPRLFRTARFVSGQSANVPSSGGLILGYNVNSSGPNYDFHVNGTEEVSDTGAFTFENNFTRVGYGATETASTTLDGAIGEIIVVFDYASTDTIQKCEGYLAHRWGETALLPGGHPYKSSAPTV